MNAPAWPLPRALPCPRFVPTLHDLLLFLVSLSYDASVPLPNLFEHTNADEIVITLAAVVTALGLLYRKVVFPVIKFGRRAMETIESVERQVQPNNGGSMRDELKRVESDVAGMKTTLDAVVGIVTRTNENVDKVATTPGLHVVAPKATITIVPPVVPLPPPET